MKRWLFPLLFLAAASYGADIQTGTTFVDGQTVTAASLNNAVNGATILPNFISDKSSASPVSTDSFVFYQASGGTLKRSTLSALLASGYTNPTFTGTTTISQATVVSGVLSPSQITANQNDYNPTSLATATTLRLSTDASRNITGLQGGSSGRIIVIHNVGSFNIVLKDDDGSTSTAANRFALTHDVTVQPDGIAVLHYDSTTSRWRAFNRPATKSYLQFVSPQKVDGTGAILQNSDSTVSYNGQAKFTNSAAASGNFIEYRCIVPEDLDSNIDLRAKFKFQLSNTDTGTHRYIISVGSQADSASYAGTLANAVNMDFAGDASGASGDVETVGWTTLTGWKGALTAGQEMIIRVARDGNNAADASTVDSYSGPLQIEYSSAQ